MEGGRDGGGREKERKRERERERRREGANKLCLTVILPKTKVT